MKRLLIALFTIALTSGDLASASAATEIIITEPSHRQIDGKFFDDELANQLSYSGRLGQLVFTPARGIRVWDIDAQLVDEVTAMTKGYKLLDGKEGTGKKVARIWLSQLKAITYSDTVLALPYGNPSGYWIHRLDPRSAKFFLAAGATHLSSFFGREISPVPKYLNTNYSALNSQSVRAFLALNSAIKTNQKFMAPLAIESNKFRSVAIFHSNIANKTKALLVFDIFQSADLLAHKVRLAPGRFTVSSQKQNLPITIANDFPKKVKVKIIVSPMNSKVTVGEIPYEILAPNSKTQVLIPVKVLTSGASTLIVDLHSEQGIQLGDSVHYQLSLRVISPVATWLTTGAAVVLFLSAIIQSFRRVRRRRK